MRKEVSLFVFLFMLLIDDVYSWMATAVSTASRLYAVTYRNGSLACLCTDYEWRVMSIASLVTVCCFHGNRSGYWSALAVGGLRGPSAPCDSARFASASLAHLIDSQSMFRYLSTAWRAAGARRNAKSIRVDWFQRVADVVISISTAASTPTRSICVLGRHVDDDDDDDDNLLVDREVVHVANVDLSRKLEIILLVKCIHKGRGHLCKI